MSALLDELRIAGRHHARKRGFALTVVCTLALTLGATVAVFAVVNTVLMRALPFASPERLVWIASVRSDNPSAPFTLPEFMDYRSQTRTLSGLAAFANWSASLAGDGVTERLQGARISANAFEVLGATPAAGRLLNDGDDRADAPGVVVLSHRLWQRQYGRAADIIGKSVRINGESFVIVGVLPAQFPLLPNVDVVTALAPDRDPLRHERNSVNFLRLFGRLGPGTAASEAEAELTAISRSLRQQFPVEYARKEAVRVDPLHEVLVGEYRAALFILLAAVTVVLATALANLASLALVAANARRAELSMRITLGASQLHLARQLGLEALLLAAIGSGLGWVVGAGLVQLAMRWAPISIPRLGEVSLDGTAALFVIAVAALTTALLVGAPLGASGRTQAGDALRPIGRGAIGDRWGQRARSVMVAGEISAALVLLLATSVLVQNLLRLHELHPGFNPDGVFQAQVSLPPTYRSPADVARFYDRLSERIVTSPGVRHAGFISIAPLSELLATVPFSVAGESADERERASGTFRAVSPGYLATVGTRLLEGRSFADTDRSDTPHVALVSAALADQFLSGRALGRQLLIDDNNTGPRPVEIVGVVENVRHTSLDLPPSFDIYLPLRQVHPDTVALFSTNQFWMIRTDSDPAAFRATFLEHLRAVDPDAALASAGTMRQFLEDSLGPRRFNLGLFGGFALTGVLLAVIGLYGLVSYAVSQRVPEIGMRMAIGATRGDVQRMILRQAAGLGIAGTAAGLVLAGIVWLLMSRITQDVSIDPAMAAGTAVLLFSVVLIAAWLPARRAARVDPVSALRAE